MRPFRDAGEMGDVQFVAVCVVQSCPASYFSFLSSSQLRVLARRRFIFVLIVSSDCPTNGWLECKSWRCALICSEGMLFGEEGAHELLWHVNSSCDSTSECWEWPWEWCIGRFLCLSLFTLEQSKSCCPHCMNSHSMWSLRCSHLWLPFFSSIIAWFRSGRRCSSRLEKMFPAGVWRMTTTVTPVRLLNSLAFYVFDTKSVQQRQPGLLFQWRWQRDWKWRLIRKEFMSLQLHKTSFYTHTDSNTYWKQSIFSLRYGCISLFCVSDAS